MTVPAAPPTTRPPRAGAPGGYDGPAVDLPLVVPGLLALLVGLAALAAGDWRLALLEVAAAGLSAGLSVVDARRGAADECTGNP